MDRSPKSGGQTATTEKVRSALGALPRVFSGVRGYELFRAEGVVPQLFDVSTDPASFHGAVASVALGAASLIDYDMAACCYERPAARARRDGFDHVWVQLISEGGLSACSQEQATALGAASAAVCDFSVATSQVSLPSRGHALMLPREAFGAADPRQLHGAALAGSRYELLRDHLLWLRANASSAPQDGRASLPCSLAEVVRACVEGAGRLSESAAQDLGAAALRRARSYMAAHLSRPDLRGDEVARAAGVSRSTLYRLATAQGGVAEMLWAIRLEAARRLLSDPAVPGRIGDIATSCGFTSLQHFSRRFREHFGFSPRNLRPF